MKKISVGNVIKPVKGEMLFIMVAGLALPEYCAVSERRLKNVGLSLRGLIVN